MSDYNLQNLNLFSIEGEFKRNEFSNIVSVLYFLYNKASGRGEASFKYSELWLNRDTLVKTLSTIHERGLVTWLERPSKKDPARVSLKKNTEIECILNRNKKIEFEKYKNKTLTKDDLVEVLGGNNLGTFYTLGIIPSWLRNVNNGVWCKYQFLTVFKIASYFNSNLAVRDGTVCNQAKLKGKIFYVKLGDLFNTLPKNKSEYVFEQFKKAADNRKIKHDNSFVDVVRKYIQSI